MALQKLSRGELPRVFDGSTTNLTPVMQLLDIEALAENRIKLTLNDGVYKSRFVIMASQLRPRVENGDITNFCIATIKKFQPQPLNNNTRKVLVVFDLDVQVHGDSVGKELGNPRVLDDKGIPVPAGTTPQAPNQQQRPQPPPAGRQVPAAGARQPPSNELVEGTPPKRPNYGNSGMNQTRPVKNEIASGNYGSNYSGASGSAARGNAAMQMDTGMDYNSISSLNPYQHKWTIKARVTSKNTRTYQKKTGVGEGQMLKLILTDQSGEISATAWNEEAVRFDNMIENNKVYRISGGRISQVKAQFAGPVKNDYEIMFGKETTIDPEEDANDLPMTSYEFVKIADLVNRPTETFVDIIGVIRNVGEPTTITTKNTGKNIPKRDIEIMDDSGTAVNCTLWDRHSVDIDGNALNRIIAIKGAKVSDFSTRSLNAGGTASILLDPEMDEAFALKGWIDTEGQNTVPQMLSMRGADYGGGAGGAGAALKTFEQAEAEGLGKHETADFFNCLCYVTNLNKDKLGYNACTGEGCNKKVIENGAGLWRCEKCNQDRQGYKFRLLSNMFVADHCSGVWCTAFGDQMEQLLGKKSEEVHAMMNAADAGAINELIKSVLYTSHVFRFRAKQDTFNDETRIKYSIQSIVPMTPKQECDALMEMMKAAGIPGG